MHARFENSKEMKLVFASNNAHKLAEVRHILSHIEIVSLREVGFHSEIEETGQTLEENSRLKAQTVWNWLLEHGKSMDCAGVFADDTGLEIDALGGQPGVYSARWAGEPSNDAKNRAKALESLLGITNRCAQFRTVITLIGHSHDLQVAGVVTGQIAAAESGSQGFGYDSLFVPDGYSCTFAMLSAEEKNAISHRARALHALREVIK